MLLEVDDSWIVVGLVPGQIRTLHTLPKGELKPGVAVNDTLLNGSSRSPSARMKTTDIAAGLLLRTASCRSRRGRRLAGCQR
ncbi:MAG: flagellar biosynthetic protein FliO [Candidatus Accumulibacter sp. UW25]